MTNEELARRLRAHAAELNRAGDNLYRVRAFRQAAVTVLRLDVPVAELLDEGGPHRLAKVPGIGRSLAETIDRLAHASDECLATV